MNKHRSSLALVLAAGSVTTLGCVSRDPTQATTPTPMPSKVAAGRVPRPALVPPPISGGTLLVARDGVTAIASDPDRDRVWIADLGKGRLSGQVVLTPGDEPGRLAEDAAGRVHVVLRGPGVLLTLDPKAGSEFGMVISRRAVCAAPRGVAYDAASDQVHVACATGELVTFAAAGGPPLRTLGLEPDLRDVVVSAGQLFVSKFRSAELLQLDASGKIVQRMSPQPLSANGGSSLPGVAWRLLPAQTAGVLMLHQRAGAASVSTTAGGYGVVSQMCSTGLVHAAVTQFVAGAPVQAPQIPNAVLAVDLAVSRDGTQGAVVAAGNSEKLPQVQVFQMANLTTSSFCASPQRSITTTVRGAVAAAFDGGGRLIVQTREPAALQIIADNGTPTPITLPGESRASLGHDLFHTMPNALLACASCHPEAGDDAHVWNFDPQGLRRTQNPRGGVLADAPYHWDGSMKDFPMLANEVFTKRMGGTALPSDQVTALGQWLDAQPALPQLPVADASAVTRGQQLFFSELVGCASCHNGDHFTNHQTFDVGTGGTFKVPSLIAVAYRAPYLHNGFARTLRDRFGASGGGDKHGTTSQLGPDELGDLVAYLQSL